MFSRVFYIYNRRKLGEEGTVVHDNCNGEETFFFSTRPQHAAAEWDRDKTTDTHDEIQRNFVDVVARTDKEEEEDDGSDDSDAAPRKPRNTPDVASSAWACRQATTRGSSSASESACPNWAALEKRRVTRTSVARIKDSFNIQPCASHSGALSKRVGRFGNW